MALISRVRTVWTGVGGSPAYTNLYVAQGTVTPAAAQAAVGNFIGSLKGEIVSACTATIEGDVATIDTATGQTVGVTVGTSTVIPCTGGASAAPPANQGLIRWLSNTYVGGRQIRGRTFVPYLRTAAIGTNGQIVGTTQTTFLNAASAYLTSLTGQAVIFSPKNGIAVQVNTYSVWNQVAVMRSRRD